MSRSRPLETERPSCDLSSSGAFQGNKSTNNVSSFLPPDASGKAASAPVEVTQLSIDMDRRKGAYEVMIVIVYGFGFMLLGVALSTYIGFSMSIGILSGWSIWWCFGPLWVGHIGALIAHIVSFLRLQTFLFIPSAFLARAPRHVLSNARREKFPFALM